MTSSRLDQLSRIGGAAQGGSAKPPKEREKLERQQPGRDDVSPAGAGEQEPETSTSPEQNERRKPADRSSSDDIAG